MATRTRFMKGFLKGALVAIICVLFVAVVGLVLKPGKPKTVDTAVTFDPVLGWSPDWWTPEREGPGDRSRQEVAETMVMGQRQQEAIKDNPYVVVIGDSVMFGTGLEEKETVSWKLDPLLKDQDVINLSVTGYSVDQYYLYLKRHLPKLQAKVVVVGLYSENDFSGTIRNNQYGGQKPLFVMDKGELVHTNPEIPIDNCLNTVSRSAIFHALWRVTHPKFDGTKEAGKTPEDAKRQARREGVNSLLSTVCEAKTLDYDHGEVVTRALFDKIVGLAEQQKAKVLFVVLPGSGHFTSTKYLEQPPDPRLRFFQRVTRESGHPFLDFFEYIKGTEYYSSSCLSSPQSCPVRQLYLDGGHFTALGHGLLAQAIYDSMQEHALLPTREEAPETSVGASDATGSVEGNPDNTQDIGTSGVDLPE